MSTGLNMSLDQAIQKRKDDTRKNSPKKFQNKRVFKKRFERRDKPFFKKDRFVSKRFDSDRPSRKFESKKFRSANRFIRRTRSGRSDGLKAGSPSKFNDTKKQSTKIKITNLDFSITHKDIMDLFSKLGTVTRNRIIYDDLGRSQGKAFVEFDKAESAEQAIKEYNGAVLDGKTMSVEYDSQKSTRKLSKIILTKRISKDNFRTNRNRPDSFRKGDFKRRRNWTEKGERRGDRKVFRKNGYRRNSFSRRRETYIA